MCEDIPCFLCHYAEWITATTPCGIDKNKNEQSEPSSEVNGVNMSVYIYVMRKVRILTILNFLL